MENIYGHLCDIFNNISKYKNASSDLDSFLTDNKESIIDILVVNSIQFQCSLGITPICNIIKESNWIDEWYSSKNDFSKRVEQICSLKDFFIINLCTKGVFIPTKEIVKNELFNCNLKIDNKYCEGPHPSSWGRLKKVEFK